MRKRYMANYAALAIFILYALSACADTNPPFDNTVYLEPNVITADDPTAFRTSIFEGEVTVEDYSDNCDEEFAGEDFYLFKVGYTRGQTVEFYIDAGFQSARAAQDIAQIYAPILGQVPHTLRRGVDVMIIRAENENWCAATGQIEIEHGNYREELEDGALEEAMMHETVHATLDDDHASASEWLDAQERDGLIVSEYAMSLPDDEDLAETFTAYYGALRNRLSSDDEVRLLNAIPARLDYLKRNFPASELSIQ